MYTTTTKQQKQQQQLLLLLLLLLAIPVHCVQIIRILPESVFYGRHLLREGDFISAVNGQSLQRLSSAECDELLAPSSTVVCIELLRKIDLNTSADGRTKTPEMKDLVPEDHQLDGHHQSSSLYRHSLPDELNQNELFARSKLRLSRRSGFDHDSLIHAQDHEQSFQSLSGRQLRDYTTPVSLSSGRDLLRRQYEDPDEYTDMLKSSRRVPVSRDRVKNSSTIKSSKVSRVRKNSPTTPDDKSEYTVDRRTIKHAKGVRFKLSTRERNAKESNEEMAREQVYSTNRLLTSGKRHKVTAAAAAVSTSLPELTETTNDHQVNKNFVVKPNTSELIRDKGYSIAYDTAVITPTTSATFSLHRNISGGQNEVFDQESLLSYSAPTLKIYTSVISLRSNGNVVLTIRVTPCNYQPFLRRQRSVSRPFQISVLQGLTGLGIEVAVVPSGTIITGIVASGPVARNGNVRYEIFRNIVFVLLCICHTYIRKK